MPLAEVRERLGIPGMAAEAARELPRQGAHEGRARRARPAVRAPPAGGERGRRAARSPRPSASRWWSSRRPAPAPKARSASTDDAQLRARARRRRRRARAARCCSRSSSTGEEHSFDAVMRRRRARVWHSSRATSPTPLTVLREPVDPVGGAAAARRSTGRSTPTIREAGSTALDGARHEDRAHAHGVVPPPRRLDRDRRGRRAAAGRAVHEPAVATRTTSTSTAPGRGSWCSSRSRRRSAATPPARLPARPGRGPRCEAVHGARARRSDDRAPRRRGAAAAAPARRPAAATRAKATSSCATPTPRWSSDALPRDRRAARRTRQVEHRRSSHERPLPVSWFPGRDAAVRPRPRRGRRQGHRPRRPAARRRCPPTRAARSPTTCRSAASHDEDGDGRRGARAGRGTRDRPRRVPVGAAHDPRGANCARRSAAGHDRRADGAASATRS